jgi:anthranilate synthase component 2
MVLVIDNYDSFTFNLVQYLGELGADVQVRRNDAVDVDGVRALAPDRIVISPGPGRPEDAGVSTELIRQLGDRVPMLGVCLGHQAMGQVFGGQVVSAPLPRHGKTSSVVHDGRGVFQGIGHAFEAARYHSLVVAPEPWPEALEIAARAEDDNVVMALRHRQFPLHGVQFHPESVLTPDGRRLLRNFLERA